LHLIKHVHVENILANAKCIHVPLKDIVPFSFIGGSAGESGDSVGEHEMCYLSSTETLKVSYKDGLKLCAKLNAHFPLIDTVADLVTMLRILKENRNYSDIEIPLQRFDIERMRYTNDTDGVTLDSKDESLLNSRVIKLFLSYFNVTGKRYVRLKISEFALLFFKIELLLFGINWITETVTGGKLIEVKDIGTEKIDLLCLRKATPAETAKSLTECRRKLFATQVISTAQLPNEDQCLYIVKDNSKNYTFNEAEHYCRNNFRGHLGSAISFEDVTFYQKALLSYCNFTYLGIKLSNYTAKYGVRSILKFTNGTIIKKLPPFINSEMYGQNSSEQLCLGIQKDGAIYYSELTTCDKKTSTFGCYVTTNFSNEQFDQRAVTFLEAEQYCKRHNAELLKIQHQDEIQLISNAVFMPFFSGAGGFYQILIASNNDSTNKLAWSIAKSSEYFIDYDGDCLYLSRNYRNKIDSIWTGSCNRNLTLGLCVTNWTKRFSTFELSDSPLKLDGDNMFGKFRVNSEEIS
uniref:C-type lectin domain-containing protein n=1 Tax=Syphacia muris TaxID=451379 RepID=A0A0N5ABK3_9BILA